MGDIRSHASLIVAHRGPERPEEGEGRVMLDLVISLGGTKPFCIADLVLILESGRIGRVAL